MTRVFSPTFHFWAASLAWRGRPWLAPDRKPWLASRPRSDGRASPMLPAHRDGLLTPARRTPVARASRLTCQLCNAGPLGRVALWSLAGLGAGR